MDFLRECGSGIDRRGELIGQKDFDDPGIAVEVGCLAGQIFCVAEMQQIEAEEGYGADGQCQQRKEKPTADF